MEDGGWLHDAKEGMDAAVTPKRNHTQGATYGDTMKEYQIDNQLVLMKERHKVEMMTKKTLIGLSTIM